MPSINIFGLAAGGGGLGVLVAAYVAASMLGLEITSVLGFALLIFVMAGAGSLILRSI